VNAPGNEQVSPGHSARSIASILHRISNGHGNARSVACLQSAVYDASEAITDYLADMTMGNLHESIVGPD
jgi:hypothetical protein